MRTVEVILPLGIEGTYTYAVPESLEAKVQPFVRVLVPLGRGGKTYVSLALEVKELKSERIKEGLGEKELGSEGIKEGLGEKELGSERIKEGLGEKELKSERIKEGLGEKELGSGRVKELRDVIDVMDDEPVLLPYQYKMWRWIADYYMCPIGDVYRAAFPSGMKQEEGYRPKMETYIRLTEKYRNAQALRIAQNMLTRSPRQLDVLNKYLELSNTLPNVSVEERLITREELTNAVHCSSAMVKNVIDRGILETYELPVGRLNTDGQPHPERIQPLTEAQQKALEELSSSLPNGRVGVGLPVSLLFGVTGSGKTEIYIHMIQKAIDEGKQVMYLLPEIALTVQIMQRLHRIFGDRLGIYHSRYSDAERVEIWQKQLSDKPYDVILGARSAVFLPMQRLGLVIVDEEHEPSYKQQDPAPRYHARSVSLMLARHFNAQVVLGTATPSMETFQNTVTGKYKLVQLTERYKGMQLPEIEVVDTADLYRRKMMTGMFSPRLLRAIREALEDDRQVILFQNRRGFAPMVECHACGWVPKCDNCDVSLTMHKTSNQLTCHYCGYTMQIPKKCPCCESTDIRVRGYGTEKVEEELYNLSDSLGGNGDGYLRIARLDLDTTRTKNAYERIINEFSEGKTNVLIGTQMVSKGLDFARVGVVGIISADTMLSYPDFRAYEHAFQMMSQVSGRAGRKDKRGLVILQTRHPDLPVIGQVVRNDYRAFFAQQSQEREMFRYPPYTRIIYVYLRHTKDPLVDSAAIEMGSRLRQLFGQRVLGPDRPAVARVKQMNIRKIVLKLELGIDMPRVRQYLRRVRDELLTDKRYASLQVYYDVDPI